MVEWWRMMESPSSVNLQFFPETHNFITMNMMAFLVFLRMFFSGGKHSQIMEGMVELFPQKETHKT